MLEQQSDSSRHIGIFGEVEIDLKGESIDRQGCDQPGAAAADASGAETLAALEDPQESIASRRANSLPAATPSLRVGSRGVVGPDRLQDPDVDWECAEEDGGDDRDRDGFGLPGATSFCNGKARRKNRNLAKFVGRACLGRDGGKWNTKIRQARDQDYPK